MGLPKPNEVGRDSRYLAKVASVPAMVQRVADRRSCAQQPECRRRTLQFSATALRRKEDGAETRDIGEKWWCFVQGRNTGTTESGGGVLDDSLRNE